MRMIKSDSPTAGVTIQPRIRNSNERKQTQISGHAQCVYICQKSL